MRSELNLKAPAVFGVASLLAAATAFAQPVTLVSDGFGDGDRDNDGVLEGAATDPGDVGSPFYLARSTSDIAISIVDDSSGIGNGSALDVLSMTTSTRGIAAEFDETTLGDGDVIRVALTVRLTESPVDATDGGLFPDGNTDRRFRYGLFGDNGTPLLAMDNSDPTVTDDDTGFIGLIDLGSADGSSYSAFGDKADGILGGSSVGLGATSTGNFFLNTTPRRLELTIRRSGDSLNVSITFDGQLVQDGTADAAAIALDNLPYTYNYVAFGMSGASVDYRVDDIEVIYQSAPDTLATTDGFEDGDYNNDLIADGPINDPADIGFAFFKATGTGDVEIDVEDDSAGIGTGNAMNVFTITTNSRKQAAAIEEITLAAPGDEIRFAFDYRARGFVIPADRDWRFGIHNDGGTPVTEDGSSQSGDDFGYMVQVDTGASAASTATVRGDLNNGLLGGSTRSLGGTTEDPIFALDDTNARRLEIRVRRETDTDLGRDVNIVEYYQDGVLATSGVDDGSDGDDAAPFDGDAPMTFTFNQISVGTHSGLGPLDYLIDNVEVTTNVGMGPMGCNVADLAPPFNILDLGDVDAFIAAFLAQDPLADIAPPAGIIDLGDVDAFIAAFLGGCP